MRWRVNQPTVIFQDMDGEVVLVNLDDGNYYSLNPSGSQVLVALEAGVPETSLGECFRYDSDAQREDAQKQIADFLQKLRTDQLVVESDQPQDSDFSHQPTPFVAPTLDKFTDMQDFLLLDPIHDVGEQGWPGK